MEVDNLVEGIGVVCAVSNFEQALEEARRIGFPILVIPHGGGFSGTDQYVAHNEESLKVAVNLALTRSYPPPRLYIMLRGG